MQKTLIGLSSFMLFLSLNASNQDLHQAIVKSYPEKVEQLLITLNPEQEFSIYQNKNDGLKDCLDLANEVLNLKKQALSRPKAIRPDIAYKTISILLMWTGLVTAIQHIAKATNPPDTPQPYSHYKFALSEGIIAASSYIIWRFGNLEQSNYDNRTRREEYEDALETSQILNDYLKGCEEITAIGKL